MNDQQPQEVLYRFQEGRYSNGVDEWDNPYPGYTLRVRLIEYPIIKRTPKGAWIKPFMEPRKFVLLTARKKFACATVEEALESFKARKNIYISILLSRVHMAEEAIKLAERKQKDSSTHMWR